MADLDEAIELANATSSGAPWTTDPEEQERLIAGIEAGAVFLNGMTIPHPEPFGGIKNSGFGRELGAPGIREFCNLEDDLGQLTRRSRCPGSVRDLLLAWNQAIRRAACNGRRPRLDVARYQLDEYARAQGGVVPDEPRSEARAPSSQQRAAIAETALQ